MRMVRGREGDEERESRRAAVLAGNGRGAWWTEKVVEQRQKRVEMMVRESGRGGHRLCMFGQVRLHGHFKGVGVPRRYGGSRSRKAIQCSLPPSDPFGAWPRSSPPRYSLGVRPPAHPLHHPSVSLNQSLFPRIPAGIDCAPVGRM